MIPSAGILLPIDFSERCAGALRYAEALAVRFGSQVVLLHVLEPLRYSMATLAAGAAGTGQLLTELKGEAETLLAEYGCPDLEKVRVKRVLLEGDPARRIVAYAKEEQVGLIAMPTHGYGPFRRFILGSVTAKVLHDAECPVLTGVHMEQAPPLNGIAFRTIVCAVDLGPESRKALSWAQQLAKQFSARLVLIHALPCIESRPGEYFDRALAGDLFSSAQQELEKLSEEMGAHAEFFLDGGDAPKVVCAAAERFHADLLVIARGSAAGVPGRLRTNAYAIIRGSPCAVVSV
jgi:nucleotide-binding universal stress UspA family protein